jgi:2'-5' RNA ligase
MSDPLRCFFAVPVPEAVRAALAPALEALPRALREALTETDAPHGAQWVAHDQLHITLKYIESLAPDAVPRLLAEAASRLCRQAPFEVVLSGIGAFPSARAARVLWLGVTRGAAQLARAARALEAAAVRCDVPRERRPFQAHVTLARLRLATALPVHGLPVPVAAGFPVDEIVLLESRLGRAGATHIPIERLPLGRAPDDALCGEAFDTPPVDYD